MDELYQLQIKADQLQERLKEIKDDKSQDFRDTQQLAIATQKQIDAIMIAIDKHNKKLHSIMNNSQEHVISAFINPAISFTL